MDQTGQSWKEHISSMGEKISSRLALLRRARKVLPKSLCLTLYNAMVLPLFDYCTVVWDSCGLSRKSYLYKLNRRAACISRAVLLGPTNCSPYSVGPICKHAETTLNVCSSINVSTEWRLLTCWRSLSMLTKSMPITPGIVTSYDCPKLKQQSTREASGLMVRVLLILSRVILDQQLTLVCSNTWRNTRKRPLQAPGADPGEVKWVNFHPPFSEPPSFFFFFSYPSNIEIIFDFSDFSDWGGECA